ncbi:MAG: MFS transporter [Paracoccaceae bacterium]|nr:MFS transporter [Paracoccaceae bacterium]
MSDNELSRNLILTRASIWLAMTLIAVWFVFIPWKIEQISISESDIGFVLMSFVIGSLVSIQISNRILLKRFPAERLIKIGLLSFPIIFFVWATSESYTALLVLALPISISFGILNSSVVSATARYEKILGRKLMPFHMACFSIGGLSGTIFGGLLLSQFETKEIALLCAVGFIFFLALALAWLRTINHAPPPQSQTSHGISRLAVFLGILAALNFGTVGIIMDWSALWLTRDLGVALALGGGIIFAFNSGEIISRVFGEGLLNRFGPRTVGATFTLIGCGVLLVCLQTSSVAIIVFGFFIFGLLTSNFFPVLLGLGVTADDAETQKNIGDINLIAFTGFVFGPTIVGFLAEAYSINLIMHLLAILWALLASLIYFRVKPNSSQAS